MPEEEKPSDGCNKHILPPGLEPSGQIIDTSMSGRHLIDITTGEIAENPLAIRDSAKSDAFVIYYRKTILWVAHILTLSILAISTYAQLGCIPPRIFVPPIELIGIILGIYTGVNWNILSDLLEQWNNFKNRPKQ